MSLLEGKFSLSVIILRSVLFSIIWWILSDGTTSSWLIGVPAILLAVAASVVTMPTVVVSWSKLLKFMPFFLLHSLRGGLDVARRAFQPSLPIEPELITYPLRLPTGLPQVFMANIVSLLPGTLCAALDQDALKVHVLDKQVNFLAELQAVEQRIGLMFNLSPNDRE